MSRGGRWGVPTNGWDATFSPSVDVEFRIFGDLEIGVGMELWFRICWDGIAVGDAKD